MAQESPKRSDLLGHYKLLEKIAQGGMAEIFRAETYDPNGLRREVVIKRILPHIASHQEFIDMLVDEAKIAVHFNHGNIAQIYDLGKVGRDYFIVMEYVSGKTLQQIAKRAAALKEKIPVAFCLYIVSELCAGLAYMHQKTDSQGIPLNVVHRDISPQNIIVSDAGNVKIIDFGVAKASDKMTITESGVLKGKFAYMSPEQAEGDEIDARSDIFSAGVILWEILAGERLFRKKNNAQTLKAVKKADVPDLHRYTRDAPKELEKVLVKALARAPKKRYASAEDLQVDLMRILYDHYPEFKPAQVAAYLERLWLSAPETVPQTEESTKKEQVRIIALEEGEPTAVQVGEETQWVEKVDLSPVIPVADHEEPTPQEALEEMKSLLGAVAGVPVEHPERTLPRWAFRVAIPVAVGLLAIGLWITRDHPSKPAPVATPPVATPQVVTPPTSNSAVLHIVVEPKDALLSFEGQARPQAPVYTFSALEAQKKYSVVVERSGFQSFRQHIALREQEEKWLTISLPQDARAATPLAVAPLRAFLLVESDPAGAEIFIDDRDTGKKTPAVLDELVAARPYRVGLAAEGLKYRSETVTLAPEKTTTLRMALESNPGVFSFISEPEGAYVTLNGKAIGATPILNYDIDPGTLVTLKYASPGWREWTTNFTVKGGERRRIVVSLKKNDE